MQTEAVVLDSLDHGESDLILTLYCRTSGRISAIAKGARKSRKRFVNKLELFSFIHTSYTARPGSSLAFLAEAELHTSFIHIRHNYRLYSVASIIREVMLTTIREGEPDVNVFRLCLWALHSLDTNQPPETVLCLFLVRFYALLGYQPEFSGCSNCKKPVAAEQDYRFDVERGGLRCSDCTPHIRQHPAYLALGTIKLLQSALDLPLERLQRLKVGSSSLRQALPFLHQYGQQIFQRDIISWRSFDRTFPAAAR
jgi:DNA repair protein RecO (recombination protein O)